MENLLDALAGELEPIEINVLWRPQLRDGDDEMVLEAAVNGGADALVTFNGRHYGAVPGQFGVDVANFRAFDKIMKRKSGKPPAKGDEVPS